MCNLFKSSNFYKEFCVNLTDDEIKIILKDKPPFFNDDIDNHNKLILSIQSACYYGYPFQPQIYDYLQNNSAGYDEIKKYTDEQMILDELNPLDEHKYFKYIGWLKLYERNHKLHSKIDNMIHEKLCEMIVTFGTLDCLIYAFNNGYLCDEFTCKTSAMYGKINCLIYLHENGVPWNELTCSAAAASGHLECLKYAHINGCPWDANTLLSAIKYSGTNSGNQYECFEYALKNNCIVNSNYDNCIYRTAMTKDIKYFKCAHKYGCKWDQHIISHAIVLGKFEKFKYMYENKNINLSMSAMLIMFSDDLRFIKYISDIGYHISSENICIAMNYNNKIMVDYLIENINTDMMLDCAISEGYIYAFKKIMDAGYVITDEQIKEINDNDLHEFIDYVNEN